jgi:hypothetical protein
MRLAGTAAPLPRVARTKVWPAGVEPAVSGARSRRGGHAPLRPDEWNSTLGGIRTRSFRVESPASYPDRPRGRESSGGRARTCISRLTVARLADSTTPERSGGSRIRTCGRSPACALAPRCLRPLGHTSEEERKGRESNPQGFEGPPVFETGYRTRWQPFQMAPAGVEPATTPIKSRRLCRVELRSRACDRQGSNLRRLAFQTSALPAELRSREGVGGAGVEPAASCVSDRRSAA